MSEKKYTPCGGCGATEPIQRCLGCAHPFRPIETPMTGRWVNLSENYTEDWEIKYCRFADDKCKLDTDLFEEKNGCLIKKGGTGAVRLSEVEYLIEDESPAEQPVSASQFIREYKQYKENLKYLGGASDWTWEKVEKLSKREAYEAIHGFNDLITFFDNVLYAYEEGSAQWEERALKAEAAAKQPVREVDKEIMEAQAEYIKLLGDELNELIGLVATRSYWQSTRVEQGISLRERIDRLYNLKEQKEK